VESSEALLLPSTSCTDESISIRAFGCPLISTRDQIPSCLYCKSGVSCLARLFLCARHLSSKSAPNSRAMATTPPTITPTTIITPTGRLESRPSADVSSGLPGSFDTPWSVYSAYSPVYPAIEVSLQAHLVG
jgi:hypothetical protein